MSSFVIALILTTLADASPMQAGDSKHRIAKLAVDQIAFDMYPKWSLAHPDRTCPKNLEELLRYVGMTAADGVDPWGTPYKIMCGKDVPAATKHFAAMSFGPDKKEHTADDVRSWVK